MLSPTESAELRQVLEADLARLVGNAQAAIGFTMDRDRDRIGRDSIDEAMEEEVYSTQLRIHDRENFLIPKIQDALKRLEAGEIDECEECSEPIGFRRLMARPVTTLCFDCKSARERVESDEPSE
jgi:DnaK suppressor protein